MNPPETLAPDLDSPSRAQARSDGIEQARQALAKVFVVPNLTYPQRLQHAKDINALLALLEFQSGIVELESRPQLIDLPVAGKCNLRCTMCGLSHGDPSYPNWTLAEVQRFEPLFKTARSVNPTGAGEPLSNRDLFSMLELFFGYGLAAGFFTNATLLTAEKSERLIRLGITQLNISIDGATKETFEAIRHGAKFETVVGNARAFVQKRRELGRDRPALQIGMVLMQENMHELVDMVRLAADIGANGLYTMFVSPLVPEKMCARDPVRTNRCLREARKVAAELKLHFHAPADLPEPKIAAPLPVESASLAAPAPASVPAAVPQAVAPAPAAQLKGHYCTYPWKQMVVWNDGNVSPCCRIRDQVDGLPFGQIQDSEPEALWNSAGMVRLRERLLAGKPPPDCVACPIRTLHMQS